MEYLVKWEIDITADTFGEAAAEAFAIMQTKGTEAKFFTVIRQHDKKEEDVELIYEGEEE